MTENEITSRKRIGKFYLAGIALSFGGALAGLFTGVGLSVKADKVQDAAFRNIQSVRNIHTARCRL